MWTSEADTTHYPKGVARGHNRIVRIPPGESVVLNSAERAPYLLIVEVLAGDLDFEPSRRANREILTRMIVKEERDEMPQRRSDVEGPSPPRRSTQTGIGSPGATTSIVSAGASFFDSPQLIELKTEEPPVSTSTAASASATISEPPEEEEEVDLVEQLYGSNVSVRSQAGDLSDSIVLPVAPKNKALDAAAWSKSSPSLSRTNSPSLHTLSITRHLDGRSVPPSPLAVTTPTESIPTSTASGQPSPRHQAPLSLEDYSERMRTAAIMLAQLNANLIREPVTTIAAPSSSANGASPDSSHAPPTTNQAPPANGSSWFPGSSWITGNRARSGSELQQASAPAMRMKLQYTEAAAIRDKIMQEMMALEEERMQRMREPVDAPSGTVGIGDSRLSAQAVEDENIVRKELNKVDPSGECDAFVVPAPFVDDLVYSCRRPRIMANEKITYTSLLPIWAPRFLGCMPLSNRAPLSGPHAYSIVPIRYR